MLKHIQDRCELLKKRTLTLMINNAVQVVVLDTLL